MAVADIRWRRHRLAMHNLCQSLRRLQGATDQNGWRGQSRSPAREIPAEDGRLQPCEQPQGCFQLPAATGVARHPEISLEGRAAVAAILFRVHEVRL